MLTIDYRTRYQGFVNWLAQKNLEPVRNQDSPTFYRVVDGNLRVSWVLIRRYLLEIWTDLERNDPQALCRQWLNPSAVRRYRRGRGFHDLELDLPEDDMFYLARNMIDMLRDRPDTETSYDCRESLVDLINLWFGTAMMAGMVEACCTLMKNTLEGSPREIILYPDDVAAWTALTSPVLTRASGRVARLATLCLETSDDVSQITLDFRGLPRGPVGQTESLRTHVHLSLDSSALINLLLCGPTEMTSQDIFSFCLTGTTGDVVSSGFEEPQPMAAPRPLRNLEIASTSSGQIDVRLEDLGAGTITAKAGMFCKVRITGVRERMSILVTEIDCLAVSIDSRGPVWIHNVVTRHLNIRSGCHFVSIDLLAVHDGVDQRVCPRFQGGITGTGLLMLRKVVSCEWNVLMQGILLCGETIQLADGSAPPNCLLLPHYAALRFSSPERYGALYNKASGHNPPFALLPRSQRKRPPASRRVVRLSRRRASDAG